MRFHLSAGQRAASSADADDYVAAVLREYALPSGPGSPAEAAARELKKLVGGWAGKYLMAIEPAGSYVKNTRVRGGTDLDLLVSLGPRTKGTVRQQYHCLFNWLKSQGLKPVTGHVTVIIQYHGLLVDLLLARQDWGGSGNHTVFETERERETSTNFETHERLVRESGRTEDIRALKIWRNLRGLRFPSFYLELVVLDALRHRAHNQPGANLLAVLEYLRDKFVRTPFRDPANFENRVSDELTEHEQMAIAEAAARSLGERDWAAIVR
ncbi:hypothetical protein JXB37_06285 [candidate division WOR-3 bacterium]|nr:hypothetical protein [candidate division WOR-3 bacterium]